MTKYLLAGKTIEDGDDSWPEALKAAHARRERPKCLCRDGGVPVSIAHIGEHFYIRRLPNSGVSHSPECDRYEMPAGLSGKAEVLGRAIVENPDNTSNVKLDFSLTKGKARKPPAGDGSPQATVKASASKLTLRGLLDYLWDEAKLTLMAPQFAGLRNWGHVRKFLTAALPGKSSKSLSFEQIVWVPEFYSQDRKEEISARRRRFLAATKEHKHKAIVIGAVKGLEPSRFGGRLTVLHMPDFPLYMKEEMFKRVQKRFSAEFGLWDGFKGSHLMAAAVIELSETGIGQVDELCFMNVSRDWIPFASAIEYELLEKLLEQRRRFMKAVRYNLSAGAPLAFGVFLDTAGEGTAMFLIPADVSEEQLALFDEAVADAGMPGWLWRTESAMPPFPPARGR